MDKSSHTILLLSACILTLFSCQQEKKHSEDSRTSQTLTITDEAIKTLDLEYAVNFELLRDLKLTKIEGQEYITFYDQVTHSIYLYDYETDDLFKKVSMEKYGPNEVKQVSRFFFHTMDSIFIDSSFGIYLINSNAEVLTKKSKGAKHKNGAIFLDFNSNRYSFSQDSYFKNGQIEMAIALINRNGEDNEYAIFDFEKDSISKELIKTETIIKNYEEVLKVKEEAQKRGG